MHELQGAWGERIVEALADLKKSRRWLAEQCDVHESTISRIVAGKVNPNDELKWKIAGALGVRMDRLWAWPTIVPPAPGQAA